MAQVKKYAGLWASRRFWGGHGAPGPGGRGILRQINMRKEQDLNSPIADERAIELILIRYALACDKRDWPLLDDVFLPDVAANYGGEYRLAGRDKVVGMIKRLLGGCGPTQHLLGNFRVSVEGDVATCACYVRAAHAGRGEQASQIYEVWAEYRDTLVRTAAGWRISERQMVVFHESGSRSILEAGQQ